MAAAQAVPMVLFGAFDRHNFGDLLFPHLAAALLAGRPLHYVGLLARDLRAYGGHQVQALASFAAAWGSRPVHVLHVGGELLTCTAWQAAVMLQSPADADAVIARQEAQPLQQLAWAHKQLGLATLAPYVVARALLPGARSVLHAGVGGVELDGITADMRDDVLAQLSAADAVGVRERTTLAHLQHAGISARLLPDPVALVAELFGDRIAQHGGRGEVAQLRARFPHGYLAVQCSADFGDDATLSALAAQLDAVARASGLGIVLFRAGAAPWHDDLGVYRRLQARMPAGTTEIFTALDIWDICALIAGSRGYMGSSLHGRIVAMAYALPRLNFVRAPDAMATCKQQAYSATWEAAGLPGCVALDDLMAAASTALAAPARLLQDTAGRLAQSYRAGFATLCRGLDR